MSSSEKAKSRKRRGRIDRPFARSIVRDAKKIAAQYAIVIAPHERLGFRGSVVEMPNLLAFGETADKCIAEMRYVATGAVAAMLEVEQAPPAPMADQRTMQINVRLTPREKLLLESTSRRRGFRGVSDFVRNAALAQTRKIA